MCLETIEEIYLFENYRPLFDIFLKGGGASGAFVAKVLAEGETLEEDYLRTFWIEHEYIESFVPTRGWIGILKDLLFFAEHVYDEEEQGR